MHALLVIITVSLLIGLYILNNAHNFLRVEYPKRIAELESSPFPELYEEFKPKWDKIRDRVILNIFVALLTIFFSLYSIFLIIIGKVVE